MKKMLVSLCVFLGVFMNGNCMQRNRSEIGGIDWGFFQKQWDLQRSKELTESDSDLRQFRELVRNDSLGAAGLSRQIFNLSKILKDKKGPKYDVARSKYVELVFAGYEDLSALSGAISMFLELIHDADDAVFSNSLLSDRIEWENQSLKVNMLIYVNELRKLRLDEDRRSDYVRKEKLLKKNLIKIFVEKITSVDELSSSDDSSGED